MSVKLSQGSLCFTLSVWQLPGSKPATFVIESDPQCHLGSSIPLSQTRKLSFSSITCLRSAARPNYTGVSAQLSLWPPLISAVVDGDLGPITGAGVRGSSLSSFCPLGPQPIGGAFGDAGLLASVPRSLGMRASTPHGAHSTLGPSWGTWAPCPSPQLTFCPRPLSPPIQLQPHDVAARAPLVSLGAFALIWPGRL